MCTVKCNRVSGWCVLAAGQLWTRMLCCEAWRAAAVADVGCQRSVYWRALTPSLLVCLATLWVGVRLQYSARVAVQCTRRAAEGLVPPPLESSCSRLQRSSGTGGRTTSPTDRGLQAGVPLVRHNASQVGQERRVLVSHPLWLPMAATLPLGQRPRQRTHQRRRGADPHLQVPRRRPCCRRQAPNPQTELALGQGVAPALDLGSRLRSRMCR